MVALGMFAYGMKDALRPLVAFECANTGRNEVMSYTARDPFGTRSEKATLEMFALGLNDAPTPAVAFSPSLGSGKSWLTMDELG